MSKQRFAVEHTGQPYAGAIPAEAWHVLSKHATLSAAEARIERELDEDAVACGRDGWCDHYRIIALHDEPMADTHYCLGYIDHNGQVQPCARGAAAVTQYVWPAGEPEPDMQTPNGWAGTTQCATCAELERIEVART